jgi:hypothetical protein
MISDPSLFRSTTMNQQIEQDNLAAHTLLFTGVNYQKNQLMTIRNNADMQFNHLMKSSIISTQEKPDESEIEKGTID